MPWQYSWGQIYRTSYDEIYLWISIRQCYDILMIQYHKRRIQDRLAIDLTMILGQILGYFRKSGSSEVDRNNTKWTVCVGLSGWWLRWTELIVSEVIDKLTQVMTERRKILQTPRQLLQLNYYYRLLLHNRVDSIWGHWQTDSCYDWMTADPTDTQTTTTT